MQIFKLIYNHTEVGRVLIMRQGLYYNIKCIIQKPSVDRPHLIAISENGDIDLGICVQTAMGFSLERLLPIKYVGTSLFQFYILPDCGNTVANISEDAPFLFVERLGNAVLRRNGENIEIALK